MSEDAALELALLDHDFQQEVLPQMDKDASETARSGDDAAVINDGLLLMLGLYLFVAGYIVFGLGWFLTGGAFDGAGGAWSVLIYGILQTSGLLLLTAVDLDTDLFIRSNPQTGLFFVLVYLIYVGFESLAPPIQAINQIFWLQAFPFFYFLLNQLREGFVRFTTLFAIALALDLVSWGGWRILYATELKAQGQPGWPQTVLGLYFITGGAAVMAMYAYQRRRRRRSHTLSMNSAIYAYLLALGSWDVICCILYATEYNLVFPIARWLFGPCHIIPTILMLTRPKQIYRIIGRRWLRGRMRRDGSGMGAGDAMDVPASRGDLGEVERAVNDASCDLNGFVCTTRSDAYSLLMLAVLNNHIDAVERLLEACSKDVPVASWFFSSAAQVQIVDVNQGSLYRGYSALFLAAAHGRTELVQQLLKSNANVHKRSVDGQTALFIASAGGHTAVIRLLMEAGAKTDDGDGFMGLTAADAAMTLRQTSALLSLRAYESHFSGHILPQRKICTVVSWPGTLSPSSPVAILPCDRCPGIYSKSWDLLVSMAKKDSISAAVVFLPQRTAVSASSRHHPLLPALLMYGTPFHTLPHPSCSCRTMESTAPTSATVSR
jgi:hypothetical protein